MPEFMTEILFFENVSICPSLPGVIFEGMVDLVLKRKYLMFMLDLPSTWLYALVLWRTICSFQTLMGRSLTAILNVITYMF